MDNSLILVECYVAYGKIYIHFNSNKNMKYVLKSSLGDIKNIKRFTPVKNGKPFNVTCEFDVGIIINNNMFLIENARILWKTFINMGFTICKNTKQKMNI